MVKGISAAVPPCSRPTISSSAALASGSWTPNFNRARQPTSVPSETIPTTSISVSTWSLPSLRDSDCAIITALIVFSVKRSNIMAILVTALLRGAPERIAEIFAPEDPRNEAALALPGDLQLLATQLVAPAACRPTWPRGPGAARCTSACTGIGAALPSTGVREVPPATLPSLLAPGRPQRSEAPNSAVRPASPRLVANAALGADGEEAFNSSSPGC
mmetsp:Transcript_62369/g.185793  ORF Transcript_62369/g.185793 Transcript_62369/m.185793 type:complete len:217 (-) Transcript_62369:213-863(-)